MADGVHLRVRGERYALGVESVAEVEARGAVTPVPGAPPVIAGVRNLRGAVLAVVDLAMVLGLETSPDARTIVVTEAGGLIAALEVDEVIGVEPLPDEVEPDDSWALRGRALTDGELVGLLDAEAVLLAVAGGTP